MAAEIVNLRRARKAKTRGAKETAAAEKRARFGRTKAEKQMEATERALAERAVEAHRREPEAE